MADQIEPFMVSVDDAALDDLRGRVRRARWPERETVSDWSQGVPLGYLQDLCGYWASRCRRPKLPPGRSSDLTTIPGHGRHAGIPGCRGLVTASVRRRSGSRWSRGR